MKNPKSEIIRLMFELMALKFWGAVTVQFKDGKPTMMRKEEHINAHPRAAGGARTISNIS